MKLSKLSVGIAALLLIGAGCAANQVPESTEPATNDTATKPTATENTNFTTTVESSEAGTIQVQWTKPSDAAAGNTFRVLHSAKPEPVLPTAYWYERSSGNAVEAEVSGVPSGKRYVRVCEYNGTECVRYSNTVEVDVE